MNRSTDSALQNRARELAEQNSRLHGDNPDAWSTLGWITLRTGNTDAAEAHLSRALQMGSTSRDTVWFVAMLNRERGNIPEADRLTEIVRQSTGPLFSQLPDSN